MSNKHQQGSRKPSSKRALAPSNKGSHSKSRDYASVLTLVDRLSSIQPAFFRRLVTAAIITTNGSGVLPVTLLCNTATVTGYPDFSSVVQLYQQYRVHAFKATFFPFQKVNTTALTSPAYAAVAPFRGGLTPAGLGTLVASPDCLHIGGYNSGIATVSFVGDNDAHLWTPTNAAVSATEDYGLYLCGTSVAASANTNVWYVLIEAVIEFRTTG